MKANLPELVQEQYGNDPETYSPEKFWVNALDGRMNLVRTA